MAYSPKCYVTFIEANWDGVVLPHSLALGTDRQIEYDADAAGDSIYTGSEAALDQEHRTIFVWNADNDGNPTFESFDTMSDALSHLEGLFKSGAYTSFLYRNEPELGEQLRGLTQTFMWFE